MLSVRGPKVSKYEVSSVASVFHPFIVHFRVQRPTATFTFTFVRTVCMRVLFLRVELNFIKEVVVLILVAQSLPSVEHSITYLLRVMPSSDSFFFRFGCTSDLMSHITLDCFQL